MPGRQFGELGRFGFNGKEQDPEVKVDGTQYDYGFRIYDPRLSRFLSVDPLTKDYPWYTPYQFAGNDVIRNSDVDGAEPDLQTIASAQKKQAVIQLEVAERNRVFRHGFFTVHKPTLGEKTYKFFNDPYNEVQFNSNPNMAAAKVVFTLADDIKVFTTSLASNGRDSRHIGGKKANFDERMGAVINIGTTAIGIGEATASRTMTFNSSAAQGEYAEQYFNKWNSSNVLADAPNFKTFDVFDGQTATSIKSIDLTMPTYTKNPSAITSTLNKYTNATLDFTKYTNNGITLEASQIQSRNVSIAVFGEASQAQQAAINSSANYAASQGVGFSLKMPKAPLSPARMLSSGIVYRGSSIIKQ